MFFIIVLLNVFFILLLFSVQIVADIRIIVIHPAVIVQITADVHQMVMVMETDTDQKSNDHPKNHHFHPPAKVIDLNQIRLVKNHDHMMMTNRK